MQLCTKSKILAPKSDWLVVVCSYFYRITNTLDTDRCNTPIFYCACNQWKKNLQKVENQPHEENLMWHEGKMSEKKLNCAALEANQKAYWMYMWFENLNVIEDTNQLNAETLMKFSARWKKSYAKRATKNICEKYTESERQISLGVALQRPARIGNLRWTWYDYSRSVSPGHPANAE